MAERPVFHPELGRFFAELRAKKGWNQNQAGSLAERWNLPGLTRQVLWRLEAGKTKNPEPDVLRSLARLYEVPYEELLSRFWETRYGVAADRVAAVKERGEPRSTTVEGFVAVPLLARPIAAGQPLVMDQDPEHDETIAFGQRFVARFAKPVCLRVGRREESMMPTILPGDVVAIDQREDGRSKPKHGHVYAINFAPLTGDEGGAVKRVELANEHLVISSDNPDKSRYPTMAFDLAGKCLLEILKGEVVWFGRYVGSGKGK